MTNGFTLVLGGARSGKSAVAEDLVLRSAAPVAPACVAPVYIATAQARDDEMRSRIAQHRAARADKGWRTIESPLDLAGVLTGLAPGTPALIDCLTLWLSNHLLAESDLSSQTQELKQAIAAYRGPLVAVANEVGLGIVPQTALGRRFRDEAGRLNQELAQQAGRVVFVAAGLPLALKGRL